jgi:hypothetical protein
MPASKPTCYRWIATGPDLDAAKQRVLQASASPRSACWIYRFGDPASGAYMPTFAGRVLVVFVFSPAGEPILQDQRKWIRFPDGPQYKGEAQHPEKIIIKSNEPGAYGIGRDVLPILNQHIIETRLADRQEMSTALGRSVPQSQVAERMKNQKW